MKQATFIHQLILETFLGKPDWDNPQVNHKNGVKTDNRLINLEWCTASENINHAFKVLGRINPPTTFKFGESSIRSKLTEKDIYELYEYIKNGGKITPFAKSKNVTYNTISSITHGVGWSHLNLEWDKIVTKRHYKFRQKNKP
jgi:hypothetical protein